MKFSPLLIFFLIASICEESVASRLLHGSAPPTSYEGFVSSRARMLNNATASFNQLMCRTAYVATEDLTSIKVFPQTWYLQGAALGGTFANHIGIEYNGVTTEVKFSGTGGAVAMADNTIIASDYISIPKIPKGATWYGREYFTGATGVYYNNWQSSALSESCAAATSGLSDQSQGTGAITGGTPVSWSRPFIAVVGNTTNPSVLIIGDSRASNVNCAGSIETDCNGKQGNIAASMGAVPFVNVSQFGEEANGWTAGPRSILLPYGSQVIVELGINDLGCGYASGDTTNCDPRNPAAGYTVSQISTAIAAIFAATGAPKKYAVTTEPHTTSTDGWVTTGNQSTVFPGSGVTITPNWSAWNTFIRAGSIPGQTGYYDVASVAATGANWIVSPSPPYTSDGLHGNTAYQTLLQSSGVIVPSSYP